MSSYPRSGPEGVPEPTGWRRRSRWLIISLAVVAGVCVIPLLALGFLWAVNPVGDEWVCSDGEVPTSSGCYPEDERLPAGVTADPLGNRPMPGNCDKDGWTLIEHDRRDRQECLNDDLSMPAGWHAVE